MPDLEDSTIDESVKDIKKTAASPPKIDEIDTAAIKKELANPKLMDLINDSLHNSDLNVNKAQPKTKQIMLDYCFAKISSTAMTVNGILNTLDASLEKKGIDEDNGLRKITKIGADFSKRIRMLAQYVIHGNPGIPGVRQDDMYQDIFRDSNATKLGFMAYKYHAFKSIWVWAAKTFLFTGKSFFSKMAKNTLNAFDMTMMRLTSGFWNWRRLSRAMIPYFEGSLDNEKLTEQYTKVRNAISKTLIAFAHSTANLLHIPDGLLKLVGFDRASLKEGYQKLKYETPEDPVELVAQTIDNLKDNCRTLITGKYKSPISDTEKVLGEDEPKTQSWYVRSKLLSQILGAPIGLAGSILNIASTAVGIPAEIVNSKLLKNISQKLTDTATAMQSLLYLTSEVPGHLEKVHSGIKLNGKIRWANLGIFLMGALGLTATFVKPFTSKFSKYLDHFFLMFFSFNRLYLHNNEFKNESRSAMQRDVNRANKYNNWFSHLKLIVRVLMRDPKVSHLNSVKETQRQISLREAMMPS